MLARSFAALLVVGMLGLVSLSARAASGDPWPEGPPGGREITDPNEFVDRIEGFWSGPWGDIVFRFHSDGTVQAAYGHDQGVIVGWLQGATIDGWWCELPSRQPSNDAGTVQFRLIEIDGTLLLDGRWTFGDADQLGAFSENWDFTGESNPDAPPDLVERLDQAEEICDNPNTRPRPFTTLSTPSSFTVATPSVISSLGTLQDLNLTPERAAVTGGLAVVLVAIVLLPQTLIDATIDANYDRIAGWGARWRRRLGFSNGKERRLPQWLPIALGLILTAIISGFVDPRFGANWGSVRLASSVAISIFFESILVMWLIARRTRRDSEDSTITFRPASLVFVVATVIVTRLSGFEPGIIFGLVFGLVILAELSDRREAHIALYASAYAFVIGIGGWLVYSFLVSAAGTEPGTLELFLIETTGGMAVSGLAALPVALFPLAITDGGTLFRWNKWVWVGVYAIALACFLVIIMPLPESWDEVSKPFAVWIALFIAYAALAVALWAVFGRGRSGTDEKSGDIDGA